MKSAAQRTFWILLGLIALSAGLTWLLARGQHEELGAINERLRLLQRYEAMINEDVERARLGLQLHYDQLVDLVRSSDRILARLHRDFALLDVVEDQGLDKALRNYTEAFEKKKQDIEDFKSNNAVFRNSLLFLPHANKAFIDALQGGKEGGERFAHDSMIVLSESLFMVSSNADYDQAAYAGALQRLNAAVRTLPRPAADSLHGFLRHNEILHQTYRRTSEFMERILEAETVTRAPILSAAFDAYQITSRTQVAVQRRVLISGVVFLLGLIVLLLWRQSEHQNNLEWSVKKRTAALHVAKEEAERAEANVRELNARFKAFLDNVPEAISLKDVEGRYLLVNAAFKRMISLSSEEIHGKTDSEAILWVADLRLDIVAHERAVFESKSVIVQEREVVFPDDSVHSMIVTKFPVLDGNGDVVAIGTTNSDVTERKYVSSLLRTRNEVLEQLAAGTDLEKVLTVLVVGAEAVVAGMQGSVLLLDEDGRRLLHGAAPNLPDFYNEAIDGVEIGVGVGSCGTSASTGEIVMIEDVMTHPYWVDYRDLAARAGLRACWSHPIKNAEGRVLGTFAMYYAEPRRPTEQELEVISVSAQLASIAIERKQVEIEQKRAEEQLRQAQKMEAVGQLTAGVAHDFNNLLAVILGNAELAADRLGADDKRVGAIVHAATRGAELTQRLLSFSRKQVLNPEIVNANNLIADISGLLRRILEEHIDIETATRADLWNCEVDPAQLENALVNLAINARDAMPDGGKLTIETANARLDDDYAAAQADVKPGQYVMLAVTDTGSGMPPEVREHVFEPFFTTKDVGAGSGLGLSMVYGFAKQSGGHVTIYSEQGEGTTIKLYLPRSTETEAVDRKPATDEVPVARGETVLVVEDDPDVRTLAVALLGNLGYQVMVAATGAAALDQLRSTTRVNLLLTDVVMPGGMNGRELATEVERRLPGIQVLYMSGYTEDAIMHHGRLDADAALLQKPFRRADLARAVRKVLDGSSV